jgi:hypothetical protein
MSALDSCSAAVTSVAWDPGKKIVFHAIAAFPPGSNPRLKALSFGIDYDPTKLTMSARGTCADFEIPGVDWLAPGTGTSQSWTTGAQTGLLTEVYWFAGYANSEQTLDSTSVSLIPHPLQHSVFVDDTFPSEVDTIAGYGRLGFGRAGYRPCPGATEDSPPGGAGSGEPSGPPDGDGTQIPPTAGSRLLVRPANINVGWGAWTFLTVGFQAAPSAITLELDGEIVRPSAIEPTTPTSCLWTFSFPPRSSVAAARLRLARGGRRDSLVVLDVVSTPAVVPNEYYYQGMMNVVPRMGALGYPRGVRSCVLDQLQNPEPRLLELLRQLGVTSIRKCGRVIGEEPPAEARGGTPQLFRSYAASFDPRHSVPAVVAIASASDAIERAKLSGKVSLEIHPVW